MLFCDVTGSTAAAELLDPEEWAEIMNGAFEHLIAPVYRFEGTLARLMGDAILAFFGAPISHEDDPQRAVMAGIEILNATASYRDEVRRRWGVEIEVRVGINTGLVVMGEVGADLRVEYTALGDAINVAARMEQAARPGTVLVSADTQRLIAPLFEFEDLGPIEVRGKTQPVSAYRVISAKSEPGSLRGIEGLRSPLIGREKEVETLRRVFDALKEGRGGIVNVIGEAGLGKSRLIEEASAQLAQDTTTPVHWIEAKGVSYDTGRPYGMFVTILRHTFGIDEKDPPETVHRKLSLVFAGRSQADRENVAAVVELLLSPVSSPVSDRVEGDEIKAQMLDALLGVWRQVSEPTVIYLDDLHWADPASVEFLGHLLQLAQEAPVVILSVFRPELQSPAWQIKLKAETDPPDLYTEIALAPLSDGDSDKLFGQLLTIPDSETALRTSILEKAAGNPLFIEEFTRTLMETGAATLDDSGLRWTESATVQQVRIPQNLQGLLTARIDRLGEDARRTLQMGAVIGRAFHVRVLKQISDGPVAVDRELNTLQSAGLIQESAGLPEPEYTFRHDLMREAAYGSILIRRRRDYHQPVGNAVEELFCDRLEEQAHPLAYHFREAQDNQRALDYSIMAGDVAARLYANEEAFTHYSSAIEMARQAGSRKLGLVLES